MRLNLGTKLLRLWVVALFALMVPALPWVLASVLCPEVPVAAVKQAHPISAAVSPSHGVQTASAIRVVHAVRQGVIKAGEPGVKHSTHLAECSSCKSCSQCGGCASGASMLGGGAPAVVPHWVAQDGACERLGAYADHFPALRERPPRLV